MSPQTYNAVREQVLGTLVELGSLNATQLKETYSVLTEKEASSQKEARLYLLNLVANAAGRCIACGRHKQRVNPSVAEGVLDVPMFLVDYPGYVETMAGRPIAGMAEVLIQKCGTCVRLEEHFAPALYPAKTSELIPCAGSCYYEPKNKERSIELPIAFQSPGRNVSPLGTAGQVFDRLLLDLNLSRAGWESKANVYITSSLLCPGVKDDGTHSSVRVAERKACSPWFDLQLAIVDPTVVICMGAEAMTRFDSHRGTVAEEAGKTTRIRGRLVGVTWHPSMVIRNIDSADSGKYYEAIRSHIESFIKQAEAASAKE